MYAEATREAEAIDHGLRAVAHCAYRIVLLHYSPSADTLEGEPAGIWNMLGSERLAGPIRAEHAPDLVLHGHAHHGSFEGAVGESPSTTCRCRCSGGTGGSSSSAPSGPRPHIH